TPDGRTRGSQAAGMARGGQGLGKVQRAGVLTFASRQAGPPTAAAGPFLSPWRASSVNRLRLVARVTPSSLGRIAGYWAVDGSWLLPLLRGIRTHACARYVVPEEICVSGGGLMTALIVLLLIL